LARNGGWGGFIYHNNKSGMGIGVQIIIKEKKTCTQVCGREIFTVGRLTGVSASQDR